jgi:hypothetical protein
MPKEDAETPQPAFVPMPSEPVHQHTSHQISSAEVTSNDMSKSAEATTAVPVAVDSDDMEKIMVTSAPIQTETAEQSKEESTEKVTKSPAERPQFEEPKADATEKPELGENKEETKGK